MAGAGPWVLYNDFKLNAFKKLMALSADTIKIALVTSSSNGLVATLTPATFAGLTGELTTSGGYTAGGATAANPALTGGGALPTITFDTDDVTWTGSGGGFTARAAVAYSFTASAKNLIGYMLLDSTPDDVVVAAGKVLTIQIAGLFTAV